MKRILNLLAIILMTTSVMMAQDKKSFTLEDLMPGGNNYFNLQPNNLHGLAWWGDLCVKPEMREVKTINPKNGEVEAAVDCSGLLSKTDRKPDTDVLNGIAYDKSADKIYITGKNWPKLFEIKLK